MGCYRVLFILTLKELTLRVALSINQYRPQSPCNCRFPFPCYPPLLGTSVLNPDPKPRTLISSICCKAYMSLHSLFIGGLKKRLRYGRLQEQEQCAFFDKSGLGSRV